MHVLWGKVRVHGRVGVLLVVLGAVAVSTGACTNPASTAGGSSRVTDTPSSATGAASPSPISPADRARRLAKDTYSGLWQEMATAGQTSNWQSPALAQYAIGDALGVVNRSLYTDHLNGVVTKGAPKINPQVTSVDPQDQPTTVMISDCGDDSEWVKYKQDGQPLNDTPGGRRSITAEVKQQADGSWKVTRFAVEGVGTC